MKTLTIANEKGGVGKTMLTTQFAVYCRLHFGLKTVVLDLDQQADTTTFFKRYNAARVGTHKENEQINFTEFTTVDIFKGLTNEVPIPQVPFLCVPAPITRPQKKEYIEGIVEVKENHNVYAANLMNFRDRLADHFDLCIIDTNPSPDIRSNTGLFICTHFVTPIQLSVESIDGIANLLDRINELNGANPYLLNGGFIGMLPSMFEKKAMQFENIKRVMKDLGGLLIRTHETNIHFDNGKLLFDEIKGNAAISRRDCIQAASEYGRAIWEVENSHNAWREMKRVFFTILERLAIEREDQSTEEMKAVYNKGKEIFKDGWKKVLRQFWLSDRTEVLSGLNFDDHRALREMRKCVPLSIIQEESESKENQESQETQE